MCPHPGTGVSPERPSESLEVVEEALGLRRGVQGVAPLLQGDAMAGPVAARPCGRAGLERADGGRTYPTSTPVGGVPSPLPVLSFWWQQLHLSPRKTPGW